MDHESDDASRASAMMPRSAESAPLVSSAESVRTEDGDEKNPLILSMSQKIAG